MDEGYLSEGEVFVPKKRSKNPGNQDGSQVVPPADRKDNISSTPNKTVEVRDPEPPPSKTKNTKKEKKINKVCHLWLQRKCHRGKYCKHLHEKKKPKEGPPRETEKDDVVEENGKPKSLYAAVHFPRSRFKLTGCSYCKVKWRGRILSCYKYYCISGNTAY